MYPERNTAVARFHPNIHHPHLCALLLLVVTALVVTLGARFTTPDATAATTDKTFETADHVITQAQDGTVTIINKKTQIAVQDTVDPASRGLTEEELSAKADGLSHQLKNNLGWDLEIEADRTRLLNETRAFSQQLHNIPQATLDLKENATLRAVRDIVDKMDGTKTCRERCLNKNTVLTMFVGTIVAFQLKLLKFSLAHSQAQEHPLLRAIALGPVVVSTIAVMGGLLAFWMMLEHELHNMPEAFKWMARLAMSKLVANVYDTWVEAIDYLAHWRTTLRQTVTDAAQHLDTLTPDDAPATDYDLAKDEL